MSVSKVTPSIWSILLGIRLLFLIKAGFKAEQAQAEYELI
jgi:hypothetical protein